MWKTKYHNNTKQNAHSVYFNPYDLDRTYNMNIKIIHSKMWEYI